MGRTFARLLFFGALIATTSACTNGSRRAPQNVASYTVAASQGTGSSGSSSSGSSTSGGSTSGGSTTGGTGTTTPSYTCSLTLSVNGAAPTDGGGAAITANVGDQGLFNVTSNTGSNQFHWYGTKDGRPDWDLLVTSPNYGSGTIPESNGGHIYGRYVVIENSRGQPLCSTMTASGGKPLTITVPPAPTCALTLGVNGGTPSQGSVAISANVGDTTSYAVSTSMAPGTYNMHWYGTRDGIADLDMIQNSPASFNTVLGPETGGHFYTRYVVLERATDGVPVCNTRTSNGGQPLNARISTGVSCSLTLQTSTATSSGFTPINTNVRNWARWKLSTVPAAGLNIHWHGTRDGVADLDVVNPGSFDGPLSEDTGGHTYVRWVTVESSSSGAVLCDSRIANSNRPLTVVVSSTPGCTLSADRTLIETNAGASNLTWGFTSQVANTRIHFTGTRNGSTDVSDQLFSNFTGTAATLPQSFDMNGVGDYVRTAVLKDGTGQPLCQTNSVGFSVTYTPIDTGGGGGGDSP